MWTDTATLRLILLSAFVGVIAFLGSYTLLVWRKRNKHTRAQAVPVGFGPRLRAWSASFAILGGLLVVIAVVVRSFSTADGTLEGHGLYAVRALPSGEATFANDAITVNEGDPLVRFTAAAIAGEQTERLQQWEEAKAKRDALLLQPLTPDPELTRRQSDARLAYRQKQAEVVNQQTQAATAARELLPTILGLQSKLAQLAGERDSARKEASAAEEQRAISQRQWLRLRSIASRGGASMEEIEERAKIVSKLDAQATNATTKATAIEEEMRRVEQAAERLEKLNDAQAAHHAEEIVRLKMQLLLADAEVVKFTDLLEEDLRVHAQPRRERERDELDRKIAAAASRLDTADRKREVRAPFRGHVLYRHASPAGAVDREAILLLSPEPGAILKTRIRDDQAEALREAETVTIELTGQAIAPRFDGRFVTATPILGEPGYSVAELRCVPPVEALRLLGREESVESKSALKASFRWSPPLASLWPFRLGVVLFALGLAGYFLAAPFPGIAPTTALVPDVKPTQLPGNTTVRMPVSDVRPATVSGSGISGEVLEIVACRLRESVLRGQLDDESITAAEWMLDRHHARAVRIFRDIFAAVPDLRDRADAILFADDRVPVSPDEWDHQRRLLRRLVRVLDVADRAALLDRLNDRAA